MKVFKTYFKIIKSLLPTLSIYLFLFAFIIIINNSVNKDSEINDFTATKTKVAFISYDDSEFIEKFKEYINGFSDMVELVDQEDSLKDALFFRKVDYIIKVPANFTKQFLKGKKINIETLKVPDSTSTTYIEMMINRYFNTASLYVKSGIDEEIINENIINDMKQSVDVEMFNNNSEIIYMSKATNYFNFGNYIFLSLLISTVGFIMKSFNNPNISKRNTISPVKTSKINFELSLGHLSLAMFVWLLFIAGSFVFYSEAMLSFNGILYIMNSFFLVLAALSISIFVGTLTRNAEAQSGISNIVSLGSSFLCGAFVPQEFLSSFTLMLGRIFPSYWYILANNTIMNLTTFNLESINPIIICILIEIAFAVGFFIITLIVSNKKRQYA